MIVSLSLQLSDILFLASTFFALQSGLCCWKKCLSCWTRFTKSDQSETTWPQSLPVYGLFYQPAPFSVSQEG